MKGSGSCCSLAEDVTGRSGAAFFNMEYGVCYLDFLYGFNVFC